MADDLDKIINDPTPVFQLSTSGERRQVASADAALDDLDAIINDSAPVYQPPAPQADGIDEPVAGWTQSLKSVTDRLTLGVGAITKGAAGMQLIAPTETTFDEARKQFETQELIRAQTDTDAYIKTHGYWGLASNVPGWALEQLPVSALGIGGGMGGIAIGTAIGITGAPLVTAGLVGGGLVVGTVMAGGMAYDLMERGVDRNTARWGGIFSGAIGGALEMLGFKGLAKGGEVALQAAVKSKVFREQMTKLVQGLALGTAAEVGTEGAQSISDSIIKTLTTRLDDKTKNDFTWEEAQSDFLDSVLRAAVVAPQLAGASVAIGRVLGERARITEEDIAAAEKKNAASAVPAAPTKPAKASLQKIARQQTAAKKTLRGLVEVRETVDLEEARQAVKDAQVALKDAKEKGRDTAFRSADLDFAKAELKAAELDNALTQLEDVLTDPKADDALKAKLEERKARLEKQAESAISDAAQAKLEKRIAKRASEIEKLRGEIRADKAAAREDGSEAKTAKRREGLQELRNQQEFDQGLLELFEEGSITVDELSKSMKPSVSTKRLQGLLRTAVKQIEQAAKDGAAAQKQKTKAVSKIIRKIIDSSRLSDSDKLLLTKKLDAADSFAKLEKVAPRIAEIIDAKLAERRREAAEAIVENLVGSIKAGKSKPSRFPSTEEKLLAIKEFYQNPDASAQFEADVEARQAKGEALTLMDEIKIDLLAMFPPQDPTISGQIQSEKDLRKYLKGQLNDSVELLARAGEAQKQRPLMNIDALIEEEKAKLRAEMQLSNTRSKELVKEQQMPISTLEAMINAIIELKADGKAEALRRSSVLESRQAANESKFWDAALVRPDGSRISDQEKASRIERAITDMTTPFATWNTLMTVITQKGKASALLDIFNPKKANSKAMGMYLDWTGKLEGAIDARGIDRKRFAELNVKLQQDAGIPTYGRIVEDAKGNKVLVQEPIRHPDTGDSLTLWEMVDFRNMLLDKDPDAISRFSNGNKFTYPGEVPAGQSTLEVIEDSLSRAYPDARALADAYRDVYADFHSVVDDSAYARWGRHIEFNPTYGGALVSDPSATGQVEMFRRITLRPRSLMAREGSSKRVMPRNAHDKMLEHLWQYAREAAWRDYEKDMPALFGDEKVRDFIIGNYGKHTYKVLTKYVEDLLKGGYSAYSEMAKWYGWIRKKAFTYFLGGKPEQYWKQLTSVVYGLQYMTPQEMFDGHADFAADPQRAIERMNQSPLLRARGWLLNPTDVDASMRFRKSGLDKLGEATMKAVERGDIHGVYLSSYPALVAELRKTGNMEKALERFEQVFEAVNSSGSIDELPAMFRGNIVERMLTIFAQQPTAQAGIILQQILKAKAGGKGEVAKLANTLAIAWIGAAAYNVMGYATTAPFFAAAGEDDENEKRFNQMLAVMPLGPYAQLPIVGQAASALWLQFLNVAFDAKLKVYVPGFLITDTVESGLKSAASFMKAANDPTDKNVDRAIWGAIDTAGRLTGIPLTNMLRPVRGLTK